MATTVVGSEKVPRLWFPIKEKQTVDYTFTIKDSDDVAIPAASLTTAILTLYTPDNGTIINSRNAQNILNANNVTISAAGVVVWSLQVADVTIANQQVTEETHRALFVFTWGGGTKSFPHEVDFVLENLGKLT